MAVELEKVPPDAICPSPTNHSSSFERGFEGVVETGGLKSPRIKLNWWNRVCQILDVKMLPISEPEHPPKNTSKDNSSKQIE